MKQAIVMCGTAMLCTNIGKQIAQGAHAALGAQRDCVDRPQGCEKVLEWVESGQKKVVLVVPGAEDILTLAEICQEAGVAHYVVRDAGKTEIEPGTITAIGIGPDDDLRVSVITNALGLRLYR